MIIQPFNSSKMKQLQILFDKAVEATMNASGLSFEEFTTSRSERSVNARVVFVDVLLDRGLSEGMIAEMSGMSQQRVNALKNSRIYRMKTLMCRMLKESVNEILTLRDGACFRVRSVCILKILKALLPVLLLS